MDLTQYSHDKPEDEFESRGLEGSTSNLRNNVICIFWHLNHLSLYHIPFGGHCDPFSLPYSLKELY